VLSAISELEFVPKEKCQIDLGSFTVSLN